MTAPRPTESPQTVVCDLDELLASRGMTLRDLSALTGISTVNLSVLKNNRGRAIRFSTLAALCAVLGCEVGDLLRVSHDGIGR